MHSSGHPLQAASDDMRHWLEEQAQNLLTSDADCINHMSLQGTGHIRELTIHTEAGNLRRFGVHRQLLKYCGFDVAKSQSGVQLGQEQLSKRGNARLRMEFGLAAFVAIRARENTFGRSRTDTSEAIPRNPDLKRKAVTIVAARMVRVAHGTIKEKEPKQRCFEQSLSKSTYPQQQSGRDANPKPFKARSPTR